MSWDDEPQQGQNAIVPRLHEVDPVHERARVLCYMRLVVHGRRATFGCGRPRSSTHVHARGTGEVETK